MNSITFNPSHQAIEPTSKDNSAKLVLTDTPLVSVIIPVYNSAQYIQKAIASVLSQTYGNYEIIVVDDGSTDETRQKLQFYKDKIRYIFQENQGSAAARNTGIKLAQGELIAFLDSDDYWSMPEKLEKQIACFQNNPELGGLNTGWKIVDGDSKHIKTVQPWHKAPQLDLETWLKKKCVRTSAMMFRKEWLEKVGGFDPELRQSHDVDLILRLSLAGCKTEWLKEETVCYRQHDSNTTKDSLKQAKYIQAVLDKFFARKDIPNGIGKQEDQIRYHTLVWIAWYQYNAGNLEEMAKFLQQSLDFSPYLRAENIAHWLDNFKRFSQERGKSFKVDLVTASSQWQKLIVSTLELKKLIDKKANISKSDSLSSQEFQKKYKYKSVKINNQKNNCLIEFKMFPSREVFLLPSISDRDTISEAFQFNKHQTPAAYVTVIKGGHALVNSGGSIVTTFDNKLVEDLSANIGSYERQNTSTYCNNFKGSVAFIALGNVNNANYLYAVFDLVARIKLLELSGNDLNSFDKFVVDRCHLKIARQIFNLLEINSEKVLISDEYPHISADLLFAPSFAEKKQKISKWACELLKNTLRPNKEGSHNNFPKLIYLKANLKNSFFIENEQELIDKLIDLGFTIVDFNLLPILDQISYFTNAKCIITNNSAYLDNIFSCEVGTKIIEIMSPKKMSNLHWILCNVCNLEHYHLVAENSKYNSLTVNLNSIESILVKSRLLTDRKHN